MRAGGLGEMVTWSASSMGTGRPIRWRASRTSMALGGEGGWGCVGKGRGCDSCDGGIWSRTVSRSAVAPTPASPAWEEAVSIWSRIALGAATLSWVAGGT